MNETKQNVVGYVYVSPRQPPEAFATQKQQLEQYCSSKGYSLHIFDDLSWARTPKPGLEALLKALPQADAVAIAKLGALPTKRLLIKFLQSAFDLQKGVIILSLGIDTLAAPEQAAPLKQVTEAFASLWLKPKPKPKPPGRPPLPLDVQRVLELHSQGWSAHRIAISMGVSVNAILRVIYKNLGDKHV